MEIHTIGQPTQTDKKLPDCHFGKIGLVLWAFADSDPVCTEGYEAAEVAA